MYNKAHKRLISILIIIVFIVAVLTCEIIDQPNKDDFVRKYIRKDIECKLTSFRIMFIL